MSKGNESVGAGVGVEPLLKSDDVAKLLGVGPQCLRVWRMRGRGPRYVQASRAFVRYRPCDVRAWMAEQTRDPAGSHAVCQHASGSL